jgi:hypothetical protein
MLAQAGLPGTTNAMVLRLAWCSLPYPCLLYPGRSDVWQRFLNWLASTALRGTGEGLYIEYAVYMCAVPRVLLVYLLCARR